MRRRGAATETTRHAHRAGEARRDSPWRVVAPPGPAVVAELRLVAAPQDLAGDCERLPPLLRGVRCNGRPNRGSESATSGHQIPGSPQHQRHGNARQQTQAQAPGRRTPHSRAAEPQAPDLSAAGPRSDRSPPPAPPVGTESRSRCGAAPPSPRTPGPSGSSRPRAAGHVGAPGRPATQITRTPKTPAGTTRPAVRATVRQRKVADPESTTPAAGSSTTQAAAGTSPNSAYANGSQPALRLSSTTPNSAPSAVHARRGSHATALLAYQPIIRTAVRRPDDRRTR